MIIKKKRKWLLGKSVNQAEIYSSKRVEIKTDSTMTNIRRISALNFINLAESGSECDNIKRHNAVISVITKDIRRCCYSTVVGPKINIIFGVRKRNLVGVMNSIALFVNAQVNAEPAHLYRCGICKTNRRALEWLHSKPELLSENEEDESSMNNITTSHTDWSDSIGKQLRSFVGTSCFKILNQSYEKIEDIYLLLANDKFFEIVLEETN
ncbi:piggyBac transposable element-derived protein 4-like [Vespula maculifrons]|uniref:PiggyBac transposable element-derived protein 4-like n=1 Tax=Vespula maculifrons TaxID=7453 RepID=A0ABD2CHV5_VESMC